MGSALSKDVVNGEPSCSQGKLEAREWLEVGSGVGSRGVSSIGDWLLRAQCCCNGGGDGGGSEVGIRREMKWT